MPVPPNRHKQDFDRVRHMRLLFVMGSYLKRGGTYEWRSHSGGDGTGTGYGHIRFVLETDAEGFWALWSEIASVKGWPV